MNLAAVLGEYRDDIDFVGVAAGSNGAIIVRAVVGSLDEQGQDHTVFLIYRDGEWVQRLIPVCTTSFCPGEEDEIFALTPEGDVVHIESGSYTSDSIRADGVAVFNRLRAATEIVRFDRDLIAAGMGREVHRATLGGTWTRCGAPIPVTRDNYIGGFLSIAVGGDGVLHAVGFYGEIDFLQKGIWRQVDRPTNLRLTRVRATQRGDLIVCGANGILLRGERDRWRVIAQDLAEDNFWDLAVWRGRTYAATSTAIVEIDDDDRCVLLPLPGEPPVRTGYVCGGGDVLWSVGDRDIAYFDGEEWHIVE